MMTKKLKDHAQANAKVRIYDDGTIELISYYTRVITITPDGKIECTGTYSATTRKHIGYFCREYLPRCTYYDIKKIAGLGFVPLINLTA